MYTKGEIYKTKHHYTLPYIGSRATIVKIVKYDKPCIQRGNCTILSIFPFHPHLGWEGGGAIEITVK